MNHAQIIFHNVTFAYETASAPLFTELTAHFQTGWTGIVGANGSGKTSLLRLATGELSPQQGTVREAGEAIYCPQRTDTAPPLFAEFIQASEGDARETRGRLKIADAWLNRWDTLSHGERKRAQIGAALWRQPHILAIDEPTNHLDAEARRLLIGALHAFSGVGLLVSHDRELLDALCHQCLFMEPPRATMRPGGVTQGTQAARQEAASIRQQARLAKRERIRLERQAATRREQASRAHNQRSKRGLDRKDHDARARKNLARVTGKDGVGGKLLNQIEGRLERARQREAQVTVTKTYELGIWLPGSVSKRNVLFALPGSSLPLGPERWLHVPDLVMRPTDRIALTGPNGGGKSTLVRQIVRTVDLPRQQVIYIPQEVDPHTARDALAQIRALPKDKLGYLMTFISRLGSRPQRLLETSEPSPGETRKLLLAMGILRRPHLIVMDEPTNHLDLPSIECLESALAECPCGLLLVSHDAYFLARLTTLHWHVREGARRGDMQLSIADSSRQARLCTK